MDSPQPPDTHSFPKPSTTQRRADQREGSAQKLRERMNPSSSHQLSSCTSGASVGSLVRRKRAPLEVAAPVAHRGPTRAHAVFAEQCSDPQKIQESCPPRSYGRGARCIAAARSSLSVSTQLFEAPPSQPEAPSSPRWFEAPAPKAKGAIFVSLSSADSPTDAVTSGAEVINQIEAVFGDLDVDSW